MPDAAILQAFETHEEARGLARATVERRRYTLRKLGRFAAPMRLLEVTPELVEEWLATYRSAETKHAYLADVHALFVWARRRRMVESDPTEELEPVRRGRALPRPIGEDDLALAVACADRRLQLVLLFGALAGLRRAEIARLRAEDCNERSIVVRRGKGAKDRVVPTHPVLWAVLRGYGVEHGWLFEGPSGGPVTPGTVGHWVLDHFRMLGITATLHATRHRYGTRLAEVCGGNMLAVRDLLGHAHVSTTEGYVAFDTSGLAGFVRQLPAVGHPDSRQVS